MDADETIKHPPITIPSIASIDPMRRWLRARVSDDLIRWAAEANYGFDADELFVAFKSQLETGTMTCTAGNPWECCTVCTHSTGMLPAETRDVAMTFVCWSVLVDAATMDWVYIDNDGYRFLTGLVESAIKLGDGAPAAAFASVAWVCRHIPPEAPKTLWRAALIVLQAAERRPLFDRPLAEEAREFVWHVEAELRSGSGLWPSKSDTSWLGRSMWDAEQVERWKACARAALAIGGGIDPTFGAACSMIAKNRWSG